MYVKSVERSQALGKHSLNVTIDVINAWFLLQNVSSRKAGNRPVCSLVVVAISACHIVCAQYLANK